MQRLIELRPFCESLPVKEFSNIHKLLLSSTEWSSVEEITSILSHFATKTTMMQRVQISLSDFFGAWGKIKFELSKLGENTLVKNLLAEMKSRDEILFNNRVLNGAVFLDPRFQKYMPNQNREQAIFFLTELYKKIELVKRASCTNDSIDQSSLLESSDYIELESFLSTVYPEESQDGEEIQKNQNDQSPVDKINIRQFLREFIGTKEPMNTSVFEYWKKHIECKPELYKLASIVHCVPPSQTTVERAFSAMALILSPLRTKISDKHLEDLLLIRLNREIFDEISPLE